MAGVVLVTGCGSGFGLKVAVSAAKAGYRVYAGLRTLESGAALEKATQALPITALQLDVTQREQREAAVARILSEQGRLDALVNNAGVALGGFLEQVEEDELRQVFEVNVFGAWAMTKACLPLLRASKGSVVMISSMSGRFALPALGVYAGSKFALEGLGEAWRHELAPLGVRVTLVEPGAYRTDIFGRNRRLCRNARVSDGPYAKYVDGVDRLFSQTVDRIARDPQEVADRVVQILGDPSPALRHPVGPGAKPRGLALRVLPFAAIESLMGLLLKRMAR